MNATGPAAAFSRPPRPAAWLRHSIAQTLRPKTSPRPTADRIRRENELPGTRDWMTTKVAVDPKTRYRSPWIEGFASRTSVRPGESITLYVSTNPPSSFRVQIYRLGYYQGHGGRLVMELAPIKGSVQPDPPIGPNRLRECAWAPCAEITIPADWTSGVYLGKLTAERRRNAKLYRLRGPGRP